MRTAMNSIIKPVQIVTTLFTGMFFLAVEHPLIAQAQFDGAMARQLESGVAALMARAQVPGASIAIV
jgi:hypothetical protein